MNIKKCIPLIVLFISTISVGFSQDLNLNELINLQSKDLDYVNNYLTDKNWEFHSSKIDQSESMENYTVVGWSLNKNSWDDKAKGWVYLYQDEGMPNAIIYQTLKSNFYRLKTAVQKSGFKLIETEALEGGLKTIYKNSKIKIIFTATTKDGDDYSSDNDIYYSLLILNYAEMERQAMINEKIKNQQLEDERKRQIEANLIEEKYLNLVVSADNLFQEKKYANAIKIYQDALSLKSGESYPMNKIKEANSILAFLKERKTKVYNLLDINKTEYNNLLANVQKETNAFLNNANSASFHINGVLKINIDTNNIVNFNKESINTDNPEQLTTLMGILTNSLKLKAQKVNGYFVNSEFLFDINISHQTGQVYFKIDKAKKIIYSEPFPAVDVKNEIENRYQYSDMGKYTVKYDFYSGMNVPAKNSVTLIKYKKLHQFPYYYLSIIVLIAAGALGSI